MTAVVTNLYLVISKLVQNIEELTLPSRIESVEEAATKAEEFARKCGCGDEHVSAIDLAIRESVANAIKHGNQFDEEKTVEIQFISADDRVEIMVSDHGRGFDPDEIIYQNRLPHLGLISIQERAEMLGGSVAGLWMGDAPVPGILQAAAAFSELGGGILLILGLLTPLAALALMGVMTGALLIAHFPAGDPFVSPTGGSSYELALVFLSAALMFLLQLILGRMVLPLLGGSPEQRVHVELRRGRVALHGKR
mgnify:CR=1 FL=1